MCKKIWSYNCLIYTMGFPILVRLHIHIGSGPTFKSCIDICVYIYIERHLIKLNCFGLCGQVQCLTRSSSLYQLIQVEACCCLSNGSCLIINMNTKPRLKTTLFTLTALGLCVHSCNRMDCTIGHVTWWSSVGLSSWYPSIFDKLLHLIRRLGTCGFQ